MQKDLKELTNRVILIAKETGLFLREQRKCFQIEDVIEKGNYDYVSYVDKEAEAKAITLLSELLPQAGFISEEGQGKYAGEDYCWIIDPLDGTSNYIHDYAPYCVSIALRKKRELVIGVVYEVCRDECFWAWKEGGAYLNGKRIHTSLVKEMNKAFIGFGLPYNAKKYRPVVSELLPRFYGFTSGIRISGSAAANLCYVAAGRFDLWFEAYIKLWDFAAGALIVSEAKGIISGFDGNLYFSDSHHIIASSNAALHQKILELLTGFVKDIK
jgi:myo-inositol-1(or 4)-monophosphatase